MQVAYDAIVMITIVQGPGHPPPATGGTVHTSTVYTATVTVTVTVTVTATASWRVRGASRQTWQGQP